MGIGHSVSRFDAHFPGPGGIGGESSDELVLGFSWPKDKDRFDVREARNDLVVKLGELARELSLPGVVGGDLLGFKRTGGSLFKPSRLEVDGGLAALAWLRTHPPVDLVLLDISMPDMSGEEVCKRLRADPAYAALKIIAYTAHAGPHDVERFLANGFDAALIKPISSQRLKNVVDGLFPADA